MKDKNNYFVRGLQISNSPAFRALKIKTNPYFSDNYELLLFRLTATADMIGLSVDANMDKLKFLCYASFLGKIDGGEDTLNYVNRYLDKDSQISELDIARSNLMKIFPHPEDIFTEEELEEIYDVVLHRSKTIEGKIVDAAHVLELVAEYMSRTGKWNIADSMKYISNNANKVKEKFKKTGTIELEPEIYDFTKTITSANNYSWDLLNDVIEKNKGNRQQLIEELSTFSFQKKRMM